MGSPFQFKTMLSPLLIDANYVDPCDQWTCVFEDFVDNIPQRKVLLDHIFVSHSLSHRVRGAMIAHELFARYSKGGLDRDAHPSDHRPVYADVL
mgnify:CR=1 FL=1